MRYLLFDNMEQGTTAEVQRLLPLVSAQRREQALKFKHTFGQFACLKSYWLLRQLLNGEGVPDGDIAFDTNEYGKPSLRDFPSLFFSISHCQAAVAVAVDRHPVGIDVERYTDPRESLIDYTMNADEAHLLRQSDDLRRDFAIRWTQKEALLKYYGTGITKDLKDCLKHRPGEVCLQSDCNHQRQYALTIAFHVPERHHTA